MSPLPLNWTERIFERLKWIFKEKWSDLYERNAVRRGLYLQQWSSGLSGLTAIEIQRAISTCELSFIHFPPTVVEFYHYAKKNINPPPRPKVDLVDLGSSPLVAKKYIQSIKNTLKPTFHVEHQNDKVEL